MWCFGVCVVVQKYDFVHKVRTENVYIFAEKAYEIIFVDKTGCSHNKVFCCDFDCNL